MARAKDQANGKLEEAVTNLTQAQAALTQGQASLAQSQAALSQGQACLTQSQATLTQAHATLAQTQATLAQTQVTYLAQKAETDREIAEVRRIGDNRWQETLERFSRIEAILLEHSRILTDITQIMHALPEAVRERMGFKPPEKQKPD